MKKLILSAVALCAFGFANAQDDGGFQAGVHVGLPMGDYKDVVSFNVGLDLAYMFSVGEGFELGIATGYDHWMGKEETIDLGGGFEATVDYGDAAFVPLAAAGKYSVTENFFVGADLGYAIYVGEGEGDGGFFYQPKVGYQMETIDVFVGYKGISSDGVTLSALTLGAAYKF
ncbi:MAG TPA: hypothetical protein VF676_06575 [Flavobacterium sp.]|jgi:hypothetical protein